MTDFPPNSFKSKDEEPPDGEPGQPPKEIRQVGEGRVRKQPLGKKFRGFFFTGDARTAAGYVGTEVMLPAIRDLIYQAGSAMIGRIIFGDTHRHRPYGVPPGYTQQSPSHLTNYGSYSRMRGGPPVPMIQQQPMMSPQARAHHNFDEIILQSRMEAEDVISQMFEIISAYEVVSVADLYKMVGLASTHVDHKWGWTDVRGSGVQPIRGGGYLLNLPEPRPLN